MRLAVPVFVLLAAAAPARAADDARSDRLPPGCVENPSDEAGRCSGKTLIKDLVVRPHPPCLAISVDNCNGGMISATSRCAGDLSVGDMSIRESTYTWRSEVEGLLMAPPGGEPRFVLRSGRLDGLVPAGTDRKRAFRARIGGKTAALVVDPAGARWEPALPCLTVRKPDLRTVTYLYISNECREPVSVEGIAIPVTAEVKRDDPRLYFELYLDDRGAVRVRRNSPDGIFTPKRYERLSVEGRTGEHRFTLSYLKSPSLCD